MKRFAQVISLLLLTPCSCEEEIKPLTELEKLPIPTQEGKNTFGCLINGQAWRVTSTVNTSSVYQQGILVITGKIITPFQTMGIVIRENSDVTTTGVYNLTEIPYREASIRYSDECDFFEENTLSGTLTITKFDKVNYIISGTFEFTTALNGCDTLRITDGRFDIKYTP